MINISIRVASPFQIAKSKYKKYKFSVKSKYNIILLQYYMYLYAFGTVKEYVLTAKKQYLPIYLV